MRVFVAVVLSSLLTLSPTQARDNQDSEKASHRPARGEVNELIEMLQDAPDTPIRFENVKGAPVTIIDAVVKAVRLNKSTSPSLLRGEFVMKQKVTLVNNTARRIVIVRLQFTDITGREEVDLPDRIQIDPYGSVVFGEHGKGQPYSVSDFLSSRVKPNELTVMVEEVRFEDGIVWEVSPPVTQVDVDTKPMPLNTAQALYTEEARRNRIQGAVRLGLLVDTDGRVKQARIIRGLPAGLNEEAMREAYNLKFKPAIKDGQPVEYWLLFEIDFNLR